MSERLKEHAWNACVGQLTEGSNPFLSAIHQEPPYLGLYSHFSSSIPQKKIQKQKKKDTPLNLFKVKDVYYFRIKIKYKLYRKSLQTDSLKIALKRLKLIKMMNKEELLNMFTFKDKDYELIFEYETIEELELILEKHKQILEIQKRQVYCHHLSRQDFEKSSSHRRLSA